MTSRDIVEIKNLIISSMSKLAAVNISFCRKLDRNGSFANITNAVMKVGDIIKVCQNERFPADMILLYTTEKSGSVFIRTD